MSIGYGTSPNGGGGSGDVTGSGTPNQVAYWNGTTNITGSNSFQFNGLNFAFGSNATLGLSGSYNKIWDFEETITDFSSAPNWEGLRCIITLDPTVDLTGGNAKSIYGTEFVTVIKSGNTKDFSFLQGPYMSTLNQGSGDINALYGPWLIAENGGTGTTTTQVGGVSVSYLSGAGVILQNQGHVFQTGVSNAGGSISHDTTVQILSPFATGTLADHVGLKIDDQKFGTSPYSIVQNGLAANFFEAYTKIGGVAAQPPVIDPGGGAVIDTVNFEVGTSNPNLGLIQVLSDENYTNPFTQYTTLGFPTTLFMLGNEAGPGIGGMSYDYTTSSDATAYAINAYIGAGTPAEPAIKLVARKSNGSGGDVALSSSEIAFQVASSGHIFEVYGAGDIWTGGAKFKINSSDFAFTKGDGTTSYFDIDTSSTTGFVNFTAPTKFLSFINTPTTNVTASNTISITGHSTVITGAHSIDSIVFVAGQLLAGSSGTLECQGINTIKNGIGNILTSGGFDITTSAGMLLDWYYTSGAKFLITTRYVP